MDNQWKNKGAGLIRALLIFTLVFAMVLSLGMGPARADSLDYKLLSVNAHVGDASESGETGKGVNLSWATKDLPGEGTTHFVLKDKNGKVLVEKNIKGTNKGEYDDYFRNSEFYKNSYAHLMKGSNNYVFTYTIELVEMDPSTTYYYTIKSPSDEINGRFTTGPAKRKNATVTFAHLGDPQVHTQENGEATGAVFNFLKEYDEGVKKLDFVYVAGDHTDEGIYSAQTDIDKKTGEPFGAEWEYAFNNGGAYKNATQNFLLNHMIYSTEGNHDAFDFNGRINPPDPLVTDKNDPEFLNCVYSVNNGPVKFIVLNNSSYTVPKDDKVKGSQDLQSNANFQKQVAFLKKEVADAKKNGMWTVVGFHKPLYTSGHHLMDKDVIEYRKALAPVLSSLDVDMVLTGHDHDYVRGFINGQGQNATRQMKLTSAQAKQFGIPANAKVYSHVNGAPLHLEAEHAGSLKWYDNAFTNPKNAKKYPDKTYHAKAGDPITANWSFLDVSSSDANDPLNKAYGLKSSDKEKKQSAVILSFNKNVAHIQCIRMVYDTQSDKMVEEPWYFDDFYVIRKAH